MFLGSIILVLLTECEFVPKKYEGCQAQVAWCFGNDCILKNVKCDITKTGNICLPYRCFHEKK